VLETLWRSQVESVLAQYLARVTDYREVASVASHIGADYHGRFLIELIQNAEDQLHGDTNNFIEGNSGRFVIVRTKDQLTVLNEGRPFNEKGIRAVTSLGLSSKDPEHNLGNKGVGFKAVFEISKSPEIYSLPIDGGSIWDETATRFRLETTPFSDKTFRNKIKDIIRETLVKDPAKEEQLREVSQLNDPVEALYSELKQVAPFKLPKEIKSEVFSERIKSLGLDNNTIKNVSTVVALPLLESKKTQAAVEKAIDEIIEERFPGSLLLFLKGITRLWIIDKVRGKTWLLSRRILENAEPLSHGALFQRISTSQYCRTEKSNTSQNMEWWYTHRNMGNKGDDLELITDEIKRIKKAVAALEISNWDKVRSAHASIAFPRPNASTKSFGLLGADGMFCMGLPTMVHTGLPAWVDGPFHGKISRTEIDFQSQEYNQLILSETVRLFWSVIDRLKQSTNKDIRREVALNLERSVGGLSNAIDPDSNLKQREIVLGAAGDTFLKPTDMVIPEDKDISSFVQIFNKYNDLNDYGFVLPDMLLLKHCRSLLEELAGDTELVQEESIYFERPVNGLSLLEKSAFNHRTHGPEFWNLYFDWVADKFDFETLQDQKIIPVGLDQLASPDESVFYKPWSRSDVEFAEGKDVNKELELQFSDEIVDESDAALMDDMQFFDEYCIQVRQTGLRKLTKRAGRLSPPLGKVLIRSPRKVDLINLILIPRLIDSIVKRKDFKSALSVLERIADWMGEFEKSGRDRVELDKVLVPVHDSEGYWLWVPPNQVYFGNGWLTADTDELLANAYGHRPASRLLPWNEFIQQCSEEVVKNDWVTRMSTVGVAGCPRILRPVIPERGYFQSYSYTKLTVINGLTCPLKDVNEYWNSWLVYLSNHQANTKTGQLFMIRAPSWIDGLDDTVAQLAIMKMILLNQQYYESDLTSRVSRKDGTDYKEFKSLWVYTIQQKQWPLIPTNLGPSKPKTAWLLGNDDQQSIFAKDGLLAHVESQYSASTLILSSLGIFLPENSPVFRIITELQFVANQLEGIEISRVRPMKTLVSRLYGWLQEQFQKKSNSLDELQHLLDAPIPLLKENKLVNVDLKEPVCLFLEDDVERARHVAVNPETYILPFRSGRTTKALVEGLRSTLGTNRVLLSSEMPLNVDFIHDVNQQEILLLDYIESEFREQVVDIITDIGILIAFGLNQPKDPKKNQFKVSWSQFKSTRLIRGRFRSEIKERSLFDAQAEGGPVLYIAENSNADVVLEESWHVVGTSHRFIWPAYVRAIQERQLERFFYELPNTVSEADRDEVSSVIGYSRSQLIDRLRPIIYAMLSKIHSDLTVDRFTNIIKEHTLTDKDLSSLLSVDRSTIQAFLVKAQRITVEEQMKDLLPQVHLSLNELQKARKALGLKFIKFKESIEGFSIALSYIIAVIRTRIAHENSLPVDLETLDVILNKIADVNVPENIAINPRDNQDELVSVLNVIEVFLSRQPEKPSYKYIIKLVNRLQKNTPKEIEQLYGRDSPKREVLLYKTDEHQRSYMATEALNDLLKVVSALAKYNGESLNIELLRENQILKQWLIGPWANRFGTLRAVRQILLPSCPETVELLDAKQAFRNPIPWLELWREFSSLGKPKVGLPPKVKVKRKLLGNEVEEDDIESIFLQGSNGEMGISLISSIDSGLDLSSLANQERPLITRLPKVKGGGGKPGRKGGVYNEKNHAQTGLIGEAFVYEHLKSHLSEFDSSCWRSGNRKKYGMEADGDDTLGYDFIYTDIEGKLTGRTDCPSCLIEVKATTGDATTPFPMTENEWYVAEESYKGSKNEVYVIIRVADATETPRIADLIVNPVKLWQEKRLSIVNHDLLVSSGKLK
jgi:hypothetical protein